MPFTFSHPALVLPLLRFKKRFFSTTGLVVGSMVPDFEYYWKMTAEKSTFSHTLLGTFWFNLPVALVLSFVFHRIIRNILIHHSPRYLYRRFARYLDFSWRRWFRSHYLLVIFSIIVGCSTHLFADWLLHYFFEGDDETLLTITDYELFLTQYRIMHFLTSLICVMPILRHIQGLPVRTRPERKRTPYFWPVVWLLTAVISYTKISTTSIKSVDKLIVIMIAAFFIGLLVATLLVRFIKNSHATTA